MRRKTFNNEVSNFLLPVNETTGTTNILALEDSFSNVTLLCFYEHSKLKLSGVKAFP